MELTHKDLTLKQIAQLVLVEIYNNYNEHKGNKKLHMREVTEKLGLKEWDDRIFQAQDLLEDMGFVDFSLKTADGLGFPKLLPKAIVYMEETGDTSLEGATNMKDKIILNFFGKVENSQINTQSHHNTQNVSVNDSSVLDKLIDVIKSMQELNLSEQKDLISDIAIIKHELTKAKPDKTFILQRIELMSKFVPLAQYIPPVIDWINKVL